jgi:riboflavin biosynthesis pyrimidine reductase
MRMVYPEIGPRLALETLQGLDHASDEYRQAAAAIDALYPWPDGMWVRANMVSTLDGRAQGAEGLTASISHPSDKFVFGRLRATCDVVLVGAGTARDEQYRPIRTTSSDSIARLNRGQSPAATLALVSRSLNFDLTSALFQEPEHDDSVQRPIIITTADSDPGRRGALNEVATVVIAGVGSVDLQLALEHIANFGFSRILCEGGPRLLDDLVSAGHLNELDLTLSPQLIGAGMSILEPARALAIPGSDSTRAPGPWPFHLAHIVEAESMLMLRYTATPFTSNIP